MKKYDNCKSRKKLKMSKTLKINMPKDFEYPEKYDFDICQRCLFCHCDIHEPIDYCVMSSDGNCPFYKNDEVEYNCE